MSTAKSIYPCFTGGISGTNKRVYPFYVGSTDKRVYPFYTGRVGADNANATPALEPTAKLTVIVGLPLPSPGDTHAGVDLAFSIIEKYFQKIVGMSEPLADGKNSKYVVTVVTPAKGKMINMEKELKNISELRVRDVLYDGIKGPTFLERHMMKLLVGGLVFAAVGGVDFSKKKETREDWIKRVSKGRAFTGDPDLDGFGPMKKIRK